MRRGGSTTGRLWQERVKGATVVLPGTDEGMHNAPTHVTPLSELLASPSELLASPSELLASPSELLASPSELLVSPSEL
jgi:hypothetical protein